MPRPAVATDSLAERILAFLRDNPGGHRPADIARGLGVPPDTTRSAWTIRVGSEVARMHNLGRLARTEVKVPDKVRPRATYSIPT